MKHPATRPGPLIVVSLALVLASATTAAAAPIEEIVVTEEDGDDLIETYQGDEIDIHDLIRQDLLLSLPMNPSCETAKGAECTYEETRAQSADESIDPRWAPLLELKKKMN